MLLLLDPDGIKILLANPISTSSTLKDYIQVLVMVVKIFLEILLIVLFDAIKCLIILY